MISYSPMTIADHAEAWALWRRTEGVGISAADGREGIERYLDRNPGFSFVARAGGSLVGTLMAGHDGRRGYLFHLAVAGEIRGRGIGRELVRRSLEALKAAGIERTHAMVFSNNTSAHSFWRQIGFQYLDFMHVYSISLIAPEERLSLGTVAATREIIQNQTESDGNSKQNSKKE